jgi:hypothetical protein
VLLRFDRGCCGRMMERSTTVYAWPEEALALPALTQNWRE